MTLNQLLAQANPRTKFWLQDALSEGGGYIEDAADDFVFANSTYIGKTAATQLCNDILVKLGQEPIFDIGGRK